MSHFISRLCMIVRVNVVLNQNMTVVDGNSRVLLVKLSVVSHSLVVSFS